jgi:hypothetical protein
MKHYYEAVLYPFENGYVLWLESEQCKVVMETGNREACNKAYQKLKKDYEGIKLIEKERYDERQLD